MVLMESAVGRVSGRQQRPPRYAKSRDLDYMLQ